MAQDSLAELYKRMAWQPKVAVVSTDVPPESPEDMAFREILLGGNKVASAAPPVQSEPVTVISGAPVEPIEYPTGYKPKYQQSEIIRQNFNEAIKDGLSDARGLAANVQDISTEASAGKSRMRDLLNRMSTAGTAEYKPDANIERRLQELDRDMARAPDYSQVDAIKMPERDMLSEIILSFGPALAGAFTGESGMIAQRPATAGARNIYEYQRKEKIEGLREQRKNLIESIKTQRADLRERYKDLVAQKKAHRDSFDKSQQREMDRIKTLLSSEKDLTTMSVNDLKDQETKLLNLTKDLRADTTKGALEVAKMERGELKKAGAKSSPPPKNPGLEKVNTEYAKDYNAFVAGGEAKAKAAIAKLKDYRAELERESKKLFQSGGGPISGSLSDAFRTEKSIALRDNIVTTANSGLKGTFGGQLSDGERKAAANEYYNDKLGPAENVKILNRKISELENDLLVQKKKANSFRSNNFSLEGFSEEAPGGFRMQENAEAPKISDKVTVTNGEETLRIPRSDLEAAKKDGFREVNK